MHLVLLPLLPILRSPSFAGAPTPTGLAHAHTCPYASAVSQSFSSCDDLGWTNAAAYGSSLVCGESDTGLGGCSGDLTWSCAVAFCESKGARLCSLSELQADETTGTGCVYDALQLWTRTACDAG